jgi:hypothetical protein
MQGMRLFLRMAHLARRPPGTRRLLLGAAVVAACLALYSIDRLFGWPDWLTPNGTPKGRVSR